LKHITCISNVIAMIHPTYERCVFRMNMNEYTD